MVASAKANGKLEASKPVVTVSRVQRVFRDVGVNAWSTFALGALDYGFSEHVEVKRVTKVKTPKVEEVKEVKKTKGKKAVKAEDPVASTSEKTTIYVGLGDVDLEKVVPITKMAQLFKSYMAAIEKKQLAVKKCNCSPDLTAKGHKDRLLSWIQKFNDDAAKAKKSGKDVPAKFNLEHEAGTYNYYKHIVKHNTYHIAKRGMYSLTAYVDKFICDMIAHIMSNKSRENEEEDSKKKEKKTKSISCKVSDLLRRVELSRIFPILSQSKSFLALYNQYNKASIELDHANTIVALLENRTINRAPTDEASRKTQAVSTRVLGIADPHKHLNIVFAEEDRDARWMMHNFTGYINKMMHADHEDLNMGGYNTKISNDLRLLLSHIVCEVVQRFVTVAVAFVDYGKQRTVRTDAITSAAAIIGCSYQATVEMEAAVAAYNALPKHKKVVAEDDDE